jgi:membrane protein YdbS with pleckstrin-like domain
MDFLNTTIPIDTLPAIEEVPLQPLEKNYLKVERIVFFITTFLLIAAGIAAFYFIESIRLTNIIFTSTAVFIVIRIIGWIADSLNYRFSGYALRQHDVLYRKGWFIRKTRVVPINRIQHVSVQSGPIERMYKLASVSIYTAGSDHADFTIRGISETTASQIKDWITGQMNESHTIE